MSKGDAPEGFATMLQLRETRPGWGPYPKPNMLEIPEHLRHLPTTRHGYPIPWVSDYVGCAEAPSDWQDIPGHPEWGQWNVNGDATWGEGTPLPARLNPYRQQKAVLFRLCGVCGRRIPDTSTIVLIGGKACITHGFREPGVHRNCARYALRDCPGINHGRIMVVDDQKPVIVPTWHDAERVRYDGPVVAVATLPAELRAGLRGRAFVQLPIHELYLLPSESATVYDAENWLAKEGIEPHPLACPYPVPAPEGATDGPE